VASHCCQLRKVAIVIIIIIITSQRMDYIYTSPALNKASQVVESRVSGRTSASSLAWGLCLVSAASGLMSPLSCIVITLDIDTTIITRPCAPTTGQHHHYHRHHHHHHHHHHHPPHRVCRWS
jgi:hypothetical protein